MQESLRTITPSLAPVVSALELREATLVSADEIAAIAGVPAGSTRARVLIHRLVQAQWLVPLPARGRYEFLPGRAGPYSRNDVLDSLRAITASASRAPQVALAGAAFLRGFSPRAPVQYDVLVPDGAPVSASLRSLYRVHWIAPKRLFGAEPLRGVMVSTRERLLIDAALWPQRLGRALALRDHWLNAALAQASADGIEDMLAALDSPRATARAGYLAERFGRPDVADRTARLGRSPVAVPLLPGSREGHRDRRFNVIDPLGVGSRS